MRFREILRISACLEGAEDKIKYGAVELDPLKDIYEVEWELCRALERALEGEERDYDPNNYG